VATTLLKNSVGKVTRVLGATRDVAARVQAEEKLKRRTELLESFLELSLDLWCIVRMDGYFTPLNHGWETTFGYAQEEMKSRPLLDLVHPDDAEATRGQFASLGEGVESLHFVNRYRRKDGGYLWLEWNSVKHGNLIYAAARDITERKLIEDALHEAYRKLNILASITRHDVNNQLTSLAGNLDLLSAMRLDPAVEQRISRSRASVEAISSMIKFTKVYEELGVKAPVWQSLHAVVEQHSKELPLGKVQIVNDIPKDIEVYADSLISKVFYNLSQNALRHGGRVATISFAAISSENGHTIVVQDDGVGIPPESKEKLFTKGIGKDHGFGLYLSREILAITGIEIKETGRPGEGARFELTVPKEAWRQASN
jgi:PAS domain S-box-containing protein